MGKLHIEGEEEFLEDDARQQTIQDAVRAAAEKKANQLDTAVYAILDRHKLPHDLQGIWDAGYDIRVVQVGKRELTQGARREVRLYQLIDSQEVT